MPAAEGGGRPAGASLTVQQLREQLKLLGQPTTGSKAELVARYDDMIPLHQVLADPPRENEQAQAPGEVQPDDKVEDPLAFTIVQLKEKLKEMGLSTTGTKAHLLSRYEEAVVHYNLEGRPLSGPIGTTADANADANVDANADAPAAEKAIEDVSGAGAPAGGDSVAPAATDAVAEATLHDSTAWAAALAAAEADVGLPGGAGGDDAAWVAALAEAEAVVAAATTTAQDPLEAALAEASKAEQQAATPAAGRVQFTLTGARPRGATTNVLGQVPVVVRHGHTSRVVTAPAATPAAAPAKAPAAAAAKAPAAAPAAAPAPANGAAAAAPRAATAAKPTESYDPAFSAPGGLEHNDPREVEYSEKVIRKALGLPAWQARAAKAVVKLLFELDKVSKAELPKKVKDMTADTLVILQQRFKEVIEMPLVKYNDHLKPALRRRVHVGTMDYMDESHEGYRRAFDFLELTTTWADTDIPGREIPHHYRFKMGCGYKPPAHYDELAKRAGDGFKVVIKVSFVATHLTKLENPAEWWPALFKEKYRKLSSLNVAFLWQFPPSFEFEVFMISRLEELVDYLETEESGVKGCRHIVDFRHGSWYRQETYEFLHMKKWCLAWLHFNKDKPTGMPGDLPNGWTDRVQTTDFCFLRLFGPDGVTHGSYDKRFLHELFDSCPRGATSYVLFGNREYVDNPNPKPRPALVNAVQFRTIFTKMDFVERIRDVRYKGDACPREVTKEERLMVNSFFLRFAKKARLEGVQMQTRIGVVYARKYYKDAPSTKRCFEWLIPQAGDKPRRLHMSLHEAKEENDLWVHLRQLSGTEDIAAVTDWLETACQQSGGFSCEESALVNGTFIRFSEKAREAGLLRSTPLLSAEIDGVITWSLSNGEALALSTEDLRESEDLWPWFVDLTRTSQTIPPVPMEAAKDADPWKDNSWKARTGEMWKRNEVVEVEATGFIKRKEEAVADADGISVKKPRLA